MLFSFEKKFPGMKRLFPKPKEDKMGTKTFEIGPINKEKGEEARNYIDTLTKPPGSLGRLEELAIQLAEIQAAKLPAVTPPGVIVFAADHGVTAEGVSAFPKEVTAQMVANFLHGGAAINVFSRQIGALFKIVDVGVATNIEHDDLIVRKVGSGTANFYKERAMSKEDAEKAINIGFEQAEGLITKGIKCLIVGEMGIGNTTSSSAILAAVTGGNLSALIGCGTGIPPEKLSHKQQIIAHALENLKPDPKDPIDILSKVGGFEIAAMAGSMIAAAQHRIPILVDGFICTMSAILADMLANGCRDYMIIGHESVEPGHLAAIEWLGKRPLLKLDMRLGEGSGAAIAFPILQSAALMINEMATFATAGISGNEKS
jgi:nicotinate-nucleotide--dimethylbenzimidazole phosphoribosyltransferase